MSSEPQLGQRRKGGMLDMADEDGVIPDFIYPLRKSTTRHFKAHFYSVEFAVFFVLLICCYIVVSQSMLNVVLVISF